MKLLGSRYNWKRWTLS